MAEAWSLFPGVYSTLVDTGFSGIATSSASTALIVLLGEKGADNQLQLYSRVDQLLNNFGNVDIVSYGQGLKIAIQYLTYSSSLYVIRATPDKTNTQSMTSIYKNLYGKYIKSGIEMKEASYANIGIASNENSEFEFVHVGPENLGNIKSYTATSPNTPISVNDRYYICAGTTYEDWVDLSGTAYDGKYSEWAQLNANVRDNYNNNLGKIAICTSISPATTWAFKEIEDTSRATIGNVNYCAAVTYTTLDNSLPLWREYENEYLLPGTYTEVIDIINILPTTAPKDGDSYLICNNPITPKNLSENLAGHEGQVITYNEELEEWQFVKYSKVFVDREYQVLTTPPSSASVGDRFIIDDNVEKSSVAEAWADYQGAIAEKTETGWRFLKLDVCEPEETGKLKSIVISRYVTETESEKIEYKRKYIIVKDVVWTTDTNADFIAYAHRMPQFNDIINASNPNESEANQSIEPFIFFYPLGRGSYYNGMYIDMRLTTKSKNVITDEEDFDRELIFDIYDTVDGNVLKVESFVVSFNPNHKDLSGNSLFIEDVLERYSNYLRCSINREIFTKDSAFIENIHKNLEQLFTRYKIRNANGNTQLPPKFENGDDGNIFDQYGNLNWEVATSILSRAYMGTIINPASLDQENPYETKVLDKEEVLIDLVFDAGYPVDVKTSILTLIDSRRQDCFGVLDMGDNSSAKEAISARRDESGAGSQFNSAFVALYEPYSLVYDAYSGRDVWISPVYHAARAYAITDSNYGRWEAPAGVKRGNCVGIKKLRYNLNLDTSYQDLFVTYNVNPIIKNRDGFNIWGQSTSLLKSSKLQDVNVVRMCIKIKRDLEFTLRDYIFDLNDATTWTLMSSRVDGYLGDLVSQGALNSFASRVYASDYDITNHRVNVDIMLDPKTVIYQILLTLSV